MDVLHRPLVAVVIPLAACSGALVVAEPIAHAAVPVVCTDPNNPHCTVNVADPGGSGGWCGGSAGFEFWRRVRSAERARDSCWRGLQRMHLERMVGGPWASR